MAPLVILLLCLVQAGAQFPGISDGSEPDLEDALLHLLLKLRQDEYFDTQLIYGRDCIFHSLSKRLEISTVLVLNSTQSDWQFSSLTMILNCDNKAELEENERTFMKLQRNRRLIYVQQDIQPEEVCDDYFKIEAYNIAIVKEDFGRSNIIYACRPFQEPNFEEVNLWQARRFYIENFRNMHSTNISVMSDMIPPRSMTFKDKNTGETKVIGYVANVITNFAQRVNATLNFKKSTLKEIMLSVRTNKLDMGITLELYLRENALETASYPYMMAPCCVMLQFPAKIPYSQVYGMILDPTVLGIFFVLFCIISVLLIYSRKKSWQDLNLANVLLNDVSLRGLLGQSFPFPSNASKHLRLILIILCFASVMLTTMYDAYLQSYFTNPPSQTPIRSFRDITKYNKKLAISAFALDEMRRINNSKINEINENILEIIDDRKEFSHLRNTLNQSYNYFVTGDRWLSYEQQQKIYMEPVFYFSYDLCFIDFLHMAIPVRRFLPYRHLFNEHIMSQNEFGLVDYWNSHTFFDMVRLGLTPLIPEDLRQPKAYETGLVLRDIFWVLQLYLAAMAFSIVCFLLEILSKKRLSKKGR